MPLVRTYVVLQGDHIAKIAARIGCTEEAIWDAEQNQELRSRGRSKEVLSPGDVLYVPATPSSVLPLTLGSAHSFVAEVPSITVEVELSVEGAPLDGESFVAEGDGWKDPGTIGPAGLVSLSVPVFEREIRLSIPGRNLVFILEVGGLDPGVEASGLKQRLALLGYLSRFREWSDEEVRGALVLFQADASLPQTGTANPETLQRLDEAWRRAS